MNKQEEINQLETHLMIFAQSVGEYGNTLNYDEAMTPEVKTAMATMQRVLEDCYLDLEKQVELLKR